MAIWRQCVETAVGLIGFDLIGFDLALVRRQQLLQPLAVGLLGLLVAMPLVVELQASPLIRIHGVRLRSLEFAVGRRLFVDGFMDGFMI